MHMKLFKAKRFYQTLKHVYCLEMQSFDYKILRQQQLGKQKYSTQN